MFKIITEKQNPFVGVLISYITKGITIIISFVTVPLLLNNLEMSQYSLWITLVSIVNWINLFDLGVGNGLKNVIARYNNENDKSLLSKYITGTFQFFLSISALLIIILIFFARYIPVINENTFYSYILYIPVIIMFPFTAFNAVLQGSLKNGFLSILSLVKAIWVFILIILLKFLNFDKIILCSIVYNLFNLFFYIIVLFSIKKMYIFSFNEIINSSAFIYTIKIIKTGIGFFILQITSLVLFNMGNYIMYNIFYDKVASYDILNNKLFFNLLMFFNIGITVFWPQFTAAMASRDFDKLVKCRKQLLLLLIIFIIGVCISIPVITPFVKWWTGGKINVDIVEIIPFVLFIILLAINYYEAVILNASEKIKIQIIISVLCMPLFFIFIFMIKSFVINSYIVIPIANMLVLIPGAIIFKIYADKIIKSFIKQDIQK
jgi:O-antigen/teichoic acid export membrane protein